MSETKLSYPKDKIKVLLLEGVHASAVDAFQRQGYVSIEQIPHALSEQELLEIIPKVHILGIRSRTKITDPVVAAGKRLLAVGCFCIGTNQVDLQAAKLAGVPVFNAPFSNTRSVAELVIAHAIHLARGITQKNAQAHQGKWDKSAKGSNEVRGKTLGIVGYGRIGTQVSILAEALGMKVLYYDTASRLAIGNAQPVSTMDKLLAESDIVTLHVPESVDTRNMIGGQEIAQMKRGAKLINLARGSVVDIPAVVTALDSGQLGGAAFDVFPAEPASNADEFQSELRRFDNVLLTPHIGGSTAEAQQNIGLEVAEKLARYSDDGSTALAVNFPEVDLPPQVAKHRLLHIHRNQPGVMAALNDMLADSTVNIAAQYLQTDADIGYVVTDIDQSTDTIDAKRLDAIAGTIKSRILY